MSLRIEMASEDIFVSIRLRWRNGLIIKKNAYLKNMVNEILKMNKN